MTTIRDHVAGPVRFAFYRDGDLHYVTHLGLQFPVPISDAGTATFLAEDKGILFMRYIRRFVERCRADGFDPLADRKAFPA